MINLKEPISNLMVKNVLVVSPQSNLLEVADIFDRKHIHHIPVVEDGLLVGLISKTDFLFFRHKVQGADEKANELKRLEGEIVERIMSRNVSSLDTNQTLADALNIFKNNFFHALPVVENKMLKGIITPMDVMNYMVRSVESQSN